MSRVLVTGGAGFVGSALVPALLERNYHVTVLDAMLFGNHLKPHPNLRVFGGDIRDPHEHLGGQKFQTLIHLACIANDPSWALDPAWGKAVNYDALPGLVQFAKEAGVERFIYASSSSVYGTKPDGVEVTEKLSCEPLTDYSKYKYLGESIVLDKANGFVSTVLRPATVCGYSPRVRLDVVVNQMTIDALTKKQITVHAGHLYRAHLHISDMVRAYVTVLEAADNLVDGHVFNVGSDNLQIGRLAQSVRAYAGGTITDLAVTNDPRSYTLNSDKIARGLGFKPRHTVDEAIASVVDAYRSGKVPNPESTHYHNIKRMEELVKERCLTS